MLFLFPKSTGLNTLGECLAGFERVKRTPIPVAYSVHLYHVVWVYIFSLPVQLVGLMGWWSVGAVGITVYIFIIILEIGSQIEDPFGYDVNDLACQKIVRILYVA